MSAAASTSARSTVPEATPTRAIRLVRVAVLLVAGIAIAFSPQLHEQLGFDRGIAAAALGALGIAHLIEWGSLSSSNRTPVALLLGIAAVASALALPFTTSVLAFAIIVAAWALASALLEFIGAAVRPGSRQDATLVGAFGVLLSLFVLMSREDQVAVLGFFGAYLLLAGVFLGISAFDIRRGSSDSNESAELAPSAS